MRGLLYVLVIIVLLPIAVARPHIGALVWVWIGLMNPHRFTWGLGLQIPSALLIAVATIVGLAFTSKRDRVPIVRETVLLLCLMVWFSITTVFALVPEDAWPKWANTSKILLMTLVLLPLLQSKTRVLALLHVMTLSIAVFGFRGAVFGIRTQGQYIVYGPAQSFIQDNNALALAELMILPLVMSLARDSPNRWLRVVFQVSVPAILISVVLSYSRGALVGLLALGLQVVLLSRKRVPLLGAVVVASLLALAMVPEKWTTRMETIRDYEEDPSAQSRINAWTFALRLARDRPVVGGGFNVFHEDLFARYAPEPESVANAHSIYFEVLGEHGFVGLLLFVALLGSLLVSLRRIRNEATADTSLAWIGSYATAIRMSIVSYMVAGAFLNMAYFDLFYYIVALVVLLKAIVAQGRRREAVSRGETWGSRGAEPAVR